MTYTKNAFVLVLFSTITLSILTRPTVAQKISTRNNNVRYNPTWIDSGKFNYRVARTNFKTKLLKKGGSPQKSAPEDSSEITPPGVTLIRYKSNHALNLKAWINIPRVKGKLTHPAVVFLHGGLSFGKADWDMTKPFRDAGFVVITPMLRGENGQEGCFTFLYEEVNDAISAGELAKLQPFINKDSIFLAGHSLGGILALLTAMSCDVYKRSVSFSGLPDMVLYHKYVIDPQVLPFDTTNMKEFEMRSPLKYAGSLECPTRLYFGTEEPWIMGSVSIQFASIAKKMGVNVEAFAIPGDHMSAVDREIKEAIKFFTKE